MATNVLPTSEELLAAVASLPERTHEPRGAKARVWAIAAELVRLRDEKRLTYAQIADALTAKGLNISGASVRIYLKEYEESHNQTTSKARRQRTISRKRPTQRGTVSISDNKASTKASGQPKQLQGKDTKEASKPSSGVFHDETA